MLRKILLGYVLSLLLLFSQQSIAAHEIWHIHDQLTHAKDQAPQHNACEQCLGLGSLESFIPATQPALHFSASHTGFVAPVSIEPRNERTVAYISRAPPAISI
ncbi:hypothetical protein ACKF11_14640 [Methylobacillus sp. Pita2]|uniref:hypothetical protein n=1 Tax=Methylobacillus sp. Pita2 TaxID=3383245 RepID=UPI0038B65D3E